MLRVVTRRTLTGVVLVFAVATAAFFLTHLSQGSVARNLLGESATAAQLAQKEAELGLDRPVVVQYIDWLGDALQGDLGTSWFTSEPVAHVLADRMPVTLSLVIAATLVTAILSGVLGIFAAVRRRGWLDRTIQVVGVVGFAVPGFWVALMLVLVFALWLPVLPATGYVPPGESPAAWVAGLVLPVTALVIGGVAVTAQHVRSAMIDALRQDYVRTLRARGLGETSVVLRHALRGAAPAALTVLSLQFIGLLGGAVVIEKIFAIPGMGMLTTQAALSGDAPTLMGVVVLMVCLVVIVNLVVDVALGWVDPTAARR